MSPTCMTPCGSSLNIPLRVTCRKVHWRASSRWSFFCAWTAFPPKSYLKRHFGQPLFPLDVCLSFFPSPILTSTVTQHPRSFNKQSLTTNDVSHTEEMWLCVFICCGQDILLLGPLTSPLLHNPPWQIYSYCIFQFSVILRWNMSWCQH